MRGSTPTLYCDGEDGDCGAWSVDYCEATASTVDGVRITERQRAPRWTSTSDKDLCPDHSEVPA